MDIKTFQLDQTLAQYNSLMALDHPLFVWMNYGLYGEDFSWIRCETDLRWKYQLNLARFNVADIDLIGARVLDTGSGRGGNCSYLVRYHKPASVVGLDMNSLQVDWCNARFKGEGITFVTGDSQALPFDDQSFDVVTNIESACHYSDKEAFFHHVHRVLATDGYFCHSCNYDDLGQVEHAMVDAGFEIVQRDDITDRVIRALRENNQNFRRLLSEIATTPAQLSVAMNLYTALTYKIPKTFSSDHRYVSWKLQKRH